MRGVPDLVRRQVDEMLVETGQKSVTRGIAKMLMIFGGAILFVAVVLVWMLFRVS